MERFSYYENAPSDEEDDSDSTIFLQDISSHINTNYDTGYDTLSNQCHSIDTGSFSPFAPQHLNLSNTSGTLRSNISDTGTLRSDFSDSGTLTSNRSHTGSVSSDTGTLKSTRSNTGILQNNTGIIHKHNTGILQTNPGILQSNTGIIQSDQEASTPTLRSKKGRKSINTEVKASPNDMIVASPQQMQVIPIQKDLTKQQQQQLQQQQLQQQQLQQQQLQQQQQFGQPQASPQSPSFPQFGFQPPSIMADISHSMLSMEQNMKRMQRQMEEQFRSMSMGSPMGPMMMPQMDTFGTFPRIKTPFTPDQQVQQQQQQQDDGRGGLLSIAGPRSPSQSTVSTIGPSSISSLSPPSPSISSSTTNDDQAYIMDRNGKKHLKMQFDMQDFKPEEVQVKKDRNRLEVSALHEEKEPNRVSCRVFHQQYHLPKDVRLTKVDSKFSPDGTLTVESAVKPRHRVKFAVEDGQNVPQLAIEPPSPQNSGNTDVLVTAYPNGVNGTPPFPVQDQHQIAQQQQQQIALQQQQHQQQQLQLQQQSRRHHKHSDDRQNEVHFKPDRQIRTVRELTPEDDYEWPDYQPPKMDFPPQQRHDQHHQQMSIADYPAPPQRSDYQQSHRQEFQSPQQQQQRVQSPLQQRVQSPPQQRVQSPLHHRVQSPAQQRVVEFQQHQQSPQLQQRKEYSPPKQIDFQIKPAKNDYKHKSKSLDRRQMQRQNSGRLQDYQQEDAFVRSQTLGRQGGLGEGVAQVYVSNTPSSMEQPMPVDMHHNAGGNSSTSRSYGTLNRSQSPPKPPKRTDSTRYNTLPNRKLASAGQSQQIHDGFSSLQRPPPPNYHQLSYLTLNGDVSPAPSSSSGSTVATAYNTYYHPQKGHHHRK